MTSRWTQEDATQFWANRKWQLLLTYPGVHRRQRQHQQKEADCQTRDRLQRNRFIQEHGHRQLPDAVPIVFTSEADDLRFWAKNSSWRFCDSCKSLVSEKLLPSFQNRKARVTKTSCSCSKGRYELPSEEDLPVRLLDLSEEDIPTLRPFDVHCGDYHRLQHGTERGPVPFVSPGVATQ